MKEFNQSLISKLLNRYPDLKYDPLVKVSDGNAPTRQNYVTRFIEKQKKLMDNGFTEEKSFEIAGYYSFKLI